MADGLIPLAPLLAILGLLFALAVLVERILMFFNWMVDRLWALKVSMEWQGEAALDETLGVARRAKAEEDLLDDVQKHPDGPREVEFAPEADEGSDTGVMHSETRFMVKPAKAADELKVLKEFYLQILGLVIAVVVCVYTRFSAWPLLQQVVDQGGQASEAAPTPAFWEFLFTGIIIGAGSKPIHFLIEFLVNRKVLDTREEAGQTPSPQVRSTPPTSALPSAPMGASVALLAPPVPVSVLKTVEDFVGFVYDGGDRPERLEHTHLRKRSVNLLVYHHTTMHADSSFEEVVREFDRKGWLTGYHCVVMKDGTIRVLCRWDRVGNHARGVNFRSLGVALHGNFEPDPSVPFSNPDGRFGIQHPTQAQVEASARVVALWAHLHDLTPAFPVSHCSASAPQVGSVTGIVPHCYIAPKACPGGNFPHALFQQLVGDYYSRWTFDTAFASALERFKGTPMVMA
ncbi:MAG: N-acetylmuramoyl-L-alanine amidase [Rhodothermales bacterium]